MKRNDAHVLEYQRFLLRKSVQSFTFRNYLEILIFMIFTLTFGFFIGYSHALYDLLKLLDYLNQKL